MELSSSGVGSNEPSGGPVSGRVKCVLVEYEPSSRGRAALFHAVRIARCRQSPALWNREMRSLAEEALAEAAALVGPSSATQYTIACGEPRAALIARRTVASSSAA